MAARLTHYADTVDVAGVAFRVVCRYPKPRFWARSRPEFLTTRRPDVTVAIAYDENFRRSAAEDTVDDAPRVRRRGRRLLVTTGYYHATVDVVRGRAAVCMAGGFGVGNLMRTLAALWLLEQGTLLLRAMRLGDGSTPVLLVSPAAGAAAASGDAVTGYVAVSPTADGLTAWLTPFVEHDGPLPVPRRLRAITLCISRRDAAPVQSSGAARALATLLAAVWHADRRRVALARTLVLAARIVTAPACRLVDTGSSRSEGGLVG
jgi:hypothetical protein